MEENALHVGFEYYLSNILRINIDIPVEGLTILSELDVTEYSHIIKDIISRNNKIFFWCKNYKIARMIEDILPSNGTYQIALIDDFKNVDRSYIDTDDFKKSKLYIPVAYVMWGVKLKDNIGVVHGIFKPNVEGCVAASEKETLSIETIKEVERIASMIGEEKDLNQTEKLLIISNFLQAYVQYVKGEVTQNLEQTYIIPNNDNLEFNPRNVDSVVLGNYGLCSSIANTTILLANNPILKIDVREAFSYIHSWNIVDSSIYVDNSRAITRNKNLFDGTLKAQELNTDFLLFGEDTANMYNGYRLAQNIWLPVNIRKDDYDRNYIEAAKENLIEKGLLNPTYPEDSITFHTNI